MQYEYQPRFRAYLRFLGKENEENADDIKIHEYIIWISRKWQEWRRLNGVPANKPLFPEDHKNFDEWLDNTISYNI